MDELVSAVSAFARRADDLVGLEAGEMRRSDLEIHQARRSLQRARRAFDAVVDAVPGEDRKGRAAYEFVGGDDGSM